MFKEEASDELITITIEALHKNNIKATLAEDLKEAKAKVLSAIPQNAEVMTMVSATLDEAGISEVLDNSGEYQSIRTQLYQLDPSKDTHKMRKLAASPDYVVGSANAVTEDGKLLWASATGSQLGAYAYTAGKVILVIGSQKIVKDYDTAIKRIYDYILPIESERAKKAYGVTGSAVNKLLSINAEVDPERISVIIVKNPAGY